MKPTTEQLALVKACKVGIDSWHLNFMVVITVVRRYVGSGLLGVMGCKSLVVGCWGKKGFT